MSDSGNNENDIAIVGISLRVPGAQTPSAFWENLRDGVESIQRLDEETLLAAGESAETLRQPNYINASGSLENMKMFDGEFFGFSPKESAILDPQHRHFTECCWEALEDAGHPPDKFEGQVGVFGGCGMGSYFYFNVCTNQELVESFGHFLLRHTGNDKDFLATRVSYTLDLRGPAVNVQTACSTSLVATHLGCQSLLSGESDLVLAGGSTILFPHDRGYLYAEGEILSPDGHCHTFDHRAQGTVLTSGAGVVALRRLEDALEDGDHVYAVIKGSAINNDGGQKVGYLAPSVDGQAAAMVEAYAVADVDPATIGYVECHGTGTYMGDPIEIAALTQAFRGSTDETDICRVGSVKTNIGHLDTAAGVASLIKAALSLEQGKIPASLNYQQPNPEIGFEHTPFRVNDTLCDWPNTDGPCRAAVNSLGVGGTNAHVVLEAAPSVSGSSRESVRPLQILRLSAKSKNSLEGNTDALADFLRNNPNMPLADIAYTLEVGRRDMERRRVVAVRDREEAIELLESRDPGRVFTHRVPDVETSVVFMFSGAAGQYPGMAADLYGDQPVFREHVDRGISRFQAKTGRNLEEVIFPGESEKEAAAEILKDPSVQLPAIFIIEYALAELWISKGVTPDLMIGHSMGENTAACIAGVLSFDDGIELLIARGELMQRTAEGAMLSVNLPVEELEDLLGDACDLASVNAPELCVAAGTLEAIGALEKRLDEREVEYRRLPFTRAAHSRLYDPILNDFRAVLEGLELHPPEIPFISNRTGSLIEDRQATSPDYWVEHLRHTVHFADGLDTLLKKPGRLLIEVGPGQSLCAFARQHPALRQQANVIPSLRHRDDPTPDPAFFLGCLGRAWASGLDVDFSHLREGEERRRVSLPTYSWNHQPYFIEPTTLTAAGEDLTRLERIEDLSDWGHRPVWLAAAVDRVEDRGGETWLIFMDGAGVGRRLKKKLEDGDQRVISVFEGDAYFRRSAEEYTLAPELGRSGYDALIQDLVAQGNTPNHIVHLWLVTDGKRFRPGSSFFHQNIQDGFYSLYFLAQSLADEGLTGALGLSVVSNGMQHVEDSDSLLYPEKATVLGPVKVIPRELPSVTCKSIDIELPHRPEGIWASWGSAIRTRVGEGRGAELDCIADGLIRELQGPAASEIVAHRGSDRFVRRFEAQLLAASKGEQGVGLRAGGTYLLTGGLGGLALSVADRLAQDLKPRLILLGRSKFPEREDWDDWLVSRGGTDPIGRKIKRIRSLEEAGAQVDLVSADVTNLEQMQAAVAALCERVGPIHGVFHIAGVVKDELIQLKLDVEIEEVFSPKVYGTLVLDSLLESMGTELFVLFSSTSAIAAPPGQVDYAAANAFLDAFAQSRRDSPVRTISINWGIWNEIGMAADSLGEGDQPSVREAAIPTGPMSHPLFDERIRDSHGRAAFLKVFSPQRDWVLDEHRTQQGQALVPGTAYPELVRTALSEYGERGPFEIRDLYFIRPLYVLDGESRDVRVQLRSSAKGYRFEVRTGCRLDGRAGWELNAQASLELGHLNEPANVDLEAVDARCQVSRSNVNLEGHRSGQEEHVRFGPRWRVLRRVAYAQDEAFAELELPEAFQADIDDFGLHPALLDYATGYAMELIEGYRPEDGLWIPVSYGRMAVYADLPKKIFSWVRNSGSNRASSDFAVFDLTIADSEGRVLIEVEEYTIKRLSEAPDFTIHAELSRADVEFEVSVGSADVKDVSPAERQLRRNYERGIRPEEGTEALSRVIAGNPMAQVVVSSLDLSSMIRQVEKTSEQPTGSATKFDRPDLDSEFVEPRDDIERNLVGMWEELLGVDRLGVRDDFFELGGHSLIAVRLFTMIKKTFQADFPISVLFEAPTIEGCAALIREAIGDVAGDVGGVPARTAESHRSRHNYLVAMDPNRGQGGTKPPFFLVAGMFGNVLNLRHLASLVGSDRPFYGLQARGLYGDEAPHETFEEMASAYIEEMRSVQPEGPYFIGGFSGGGITAFEMAHQLRASGDAVGMLLLLDSGLPQTPGLSALDRASIQWQRVRQRGPGYVIDWARNRARWEMEKLRKRLGVDEEPVRSQDQFHNDAIEEAFRGALPRYEMKHYSGPVVLYRPKLDRAYVLGPDRVLDTAKEWVWDDNGFGAWAAEIEIFEMPGNHDSMVLEPNVRVMAAQLHRSLARAEERMAEGRERD